LAGLDVLLLYNEPTLGGDHADRASEEGVLVSLAAIDEAARAAGHRVTRLGLDRSPEPFWRAVSGSTRPDVVVNLFEGFAGVGRGEAQVAAIAEVFEVPLTGSGSECLALVRDKVRTKLLLAGAGLPTPEFLAIAADDPLPLEQLGRLIEQGPLIVKPACEDASLGLSPASVVTVPAALEAQCDVVRKRYGAVLVERFIEGREFNVGIIALPDAEVLPLAEVEFTTDLPALERLVTYDAKWSTGSREDLASPVRCPAVVDRPLAEKIREAGLRAFRATGCRDYARVDVRVGPDGGVWILEVNGNPDLAPDAGLARALKCTGISYRDFVERLLSVAADRHSRPSQRPTGPAQERSDPAKKTTGRVQLRPVKTRDLEDLVSILRACPEFRPEEVAVGEEVLREAIKPARLEDYIVTVAVDQEQTIGWSCHGRVPLTDATYDLYWIAVLPEYQNQGVGGQLLAHIERQLASERARWLLAETSASSGYGKTRRFYERQGFELLSTIDDFYRAGDGRLIFGKRIDRLSALVGKPPVAPGAPDGASGR